MSERELCTLSVTNQLLDDGISDTFVRLQSSRRTGEKCQSVLERALCGSLSDIMGSDESQHIAGSQGFRAVFPSTLAHSVACRALIDAYILH